MSKHSEPETRTPHPLDVALGQRIRARRKSAKISQSELGAKVGVTFQQIQKYERGTNRVSFSMLIMITRGLDCTVADLIDGIDDATADSFGSASVDPGKKSAEDVQGAGR